jgi:hypothetical protein
MCLTALLLRVAIAGTVMFFQQVLVPGLYRTRFLMIDWQNNSGLVSMRYYTMLQLSSKGSG